MSTFKLLKSNERLIGRVGCDGLGGLSVTSVKFHKI